MEVEDKVSPDAIGRRPLPEDRRGHVDCAPCQAPWREATSSTSTLTVATTVLSSWTK